MLELLAVDIEAVDHQPNLAHLALNERLRLCLAPERAWNLHQLLQQAPIGRLESFDRIDDPRFGSGSVLCHLSSPLEAAIAPARVTTRRLFSDDRPRRLFAMMNLYSPSSGTFITTVNAPVCCTWP